MDSFLALKENNDDSSHTYQQSGSAQSANLSLKDGVFKLEVDLTLSQPIYPTIGSKVSEYEL